MTVPAPAPLRGWLGRLLARDPLLVMGALAWLVLNLVVANATLAEVIIPDCHLFGYAALLAIAFAVALIGMQIFVGTFPIYRWWSLVIALLAMTATCCIDAHTLGRLTASV